MLNLQAVIISIALTLPVHSIDNIYIGEGHATAYCVSGVTASGEITRTGICAGADEYMGKLVILYQRLPDGSVGDKIGIYECLDTGGNPGIKKGEVIDVWCPDLDSCQEFMDAVYEDGCQGKIYMQIFDAEG